jgi:secreted protein with Ig-like and vWFA domain
VTGLSTPEQSARAILDIFKFRNCYAGDPLGYIKTQFLENHGNARDYDAGLMYAEDNGWLEVIPTTRDMQPSNMLTLTVAGFAQI